MDARQREGAVGLYCTWRPDISDIFEVRLWQAATFDWPDVTEGLRRYVVHHRFMLEERFKNVDDYDIKLRGRYRLSFSYPINRYTVQVGAFYLPDDHRLAIFSRRCSLIRCHLRLCMERLLIGAPGSASYGASLNISGLAARLRYSLGVMRVRA